MLYYDTEEVAGVARRTERQRAGRCYELAGYALLLGSAPSDATLIHGSIEGFGLPRIGHAWLLLNADGDVWEPMQARVWPGRIWQAMAQPEVHGTYDRDELAAAALEHGHWGPWR